VGWKARMRAAGRRSGLCPQPLGTTTRAQARPGPPPPREGLAPRRKLPGGLQGEGSVAIAQSQVGMRTGGHMAPRSCCVWPLTAVAPRSSARWRPAAQSDTSQQPPPSVPRRRGPADAPPSPDMAAKPTPNSRGPAAPRHGGRADAQQPPPSAPRRRGPADAPPPPDIAAEPSYFLSEGKRESRSASMAFLFPGGRHWPSS